MIAFKFVVALGIGAFFFAADASAQTNTWTAGFPKKTPCGGAGSIDVAGTAVPTTGWGLQGIGVISYFPTAGGVVQTVPITVDKTTGAWMATFVSTYGAGTQITIVVQATEKKTGNMPQNISTAAQSITP